MRSYPVMTFDFSAALPPAPKNETKTAAGLARRFRRFVAEEIGADNVLEGEAFSEMLAIAFDSLWGREPKTAADREMMRKAAALAMRPAPIEGR